VNSAAPADARRAAGRVGPGATRAADGWAARFLGLTNLLDADIVGRGRVTTTIGMLQVEKWKKRVPVAIEIRNYGQNARSLPGARGGLNFAY